MPGTAFQLVKKQPVATLNLEVQEYLHEPTGARHFHMQSNDGNNAFLVAFPTVPQDSTGVAHILEHTSLCGSRRYPVRDPFFMMIRRSLNTFMNAFTASDWTAYPFASQNRKDFDNLLEVYLDAVFFPNLNELDFSQEGHRVEFEDPKDASTPLVYKGVVFNEMKGAMSSPVSQLWQELQSNLFPTTTYHYNSGGDPAVIPSLGYEQLKRFHAEHYHPSNAIFMTYGDFPVSAHQAKMEKLALSSFQRGEFDLSIPDERRYDKPVEIETAYALDDDNEELRDKTHVVLGWLLGRTIDPREVLSVELLTGVLLDNSASPLRQALETSDLGTAPSEVCGLDDSLSEGVFSAGLEGAEPQNAQAIEQLILDVLNDVADKGVPAEQVESVLHQIELSQREVGGGRFPYGLQLMMRALPMVLHGGEATAALDIDSVLAELREDIKHPNFIKDLTQRWLLDNPHRVRLTMKPDPELSNQRLAQERARLQKLKDTMDDTQKSKVVELAAVLKERQEAEDDPELLPKVTLADVPADIKIPESAHDDVNGMPATWFAQGTNGLVYQQIVVELPALDAETTAELPLFCDCLTEVGVGNLDYLSVQRRQAAVTGGLSARASVRPTIDDVHDVSGYFVIAGKALVRNQRPVTELLEQTLETARFDELPRLRELIAQMRAYRESQVTDSGHAFAMKAATAGMSPCGALAHEWDGLLSIRHLKTLDKALDEKAGLEAFAQRLEHIRDLVRQAPRRALVVAEETQHEQFKTTLGEHWHQASVNGHRPFAFENGNGAAQVRQAWETSTQVNYCATAYPAVAQDHPDAAALSVLGPFLRNGYLHRTIREQGGAYGGGANFNADAGAFRFFSYRDPRLGGTLEDFDAAAEWLQTANHPQRSLEEAILGVVADIDRPGSPAGEAINTFHSSLHGRTPERRRIFRQRILKISLEDLKRVGDTYLQADKASTAVIGNHETLQESSGLGLERQKL
ncbi:MAG: insulinase family protein [Gammaproteobacteria bacterium]